MRQRDGYAKAADTGRAEAAPRAGRGRRRGSTLSAEELDRLTADIVAALKTVYDPEIPVRHLRARPHLQDRYRR